MTFGESMRLTDKMNEALHKKQPAREENYYRTLAKVLLRENRPILAASAAAGDQRHPTANVQAACSQPRPICSQPAASEPCSSEQGSVSGRKGSLLPDSPSF